MESSPLILCKFTISNNESQNSLRNRIQCIRKSFGKAYRLTIVYENVYLIDNVIAIAMKYSWYLRTRYYKGIETKGLLSKNLDPLFLVPGSSFVGL